jgi:hypothetical protein
MIWRARKQSRTLWSPWKSGWTNCLFGVNL